jgi:hypothetical protein
MGFVLSQDRPQVPRVEDQHPIGDLGPGVSTKRSAKAFIPRRLDGGADHLTLAAWNTALNTAVKL